MTHEINAESPIADALSNSPSNSPSSSPSRLERSQRRKDDHIALCYQGEVTLEGDRGLWSDVHLEHDALPELSMTDVDLSAALFGSTFSAPLMLTGMTGGTERAAMINRGLADVCQTLKIPFGLGSQRIMTHAPSAEISAAELERARASFMVKERTPDVFLIANIGVNQLRDLGVERVERLCADVGADALAVHLNPAMELIQPGREADSDFSGGLSALREVTEALDHVIVKECGCGISRSVAERLSAAGVKNVDVSGVGGTSWVKLEAMRAREEREYSREARLGMLLADWGIPTAAATWHAAQTPMRVISSGGITDALQATKALALGADMVGLARPALQAFLSGYDRGGEELARAEALAFLEELIYGMRVITALTGRRTPDQLRDAPRVIGPRLRAWLEPS